MAGRIKRTVKGCFRNAAGKGLAVAKTARAALARMREQQAAEQERKWQLLNRGRSSNFRSSVADRAAGRARDAAEMGSSANETGGL